MKFEALPIWDYYFRRPR